MPVSLGETDGRAASSILRDKVIADRSLGTVLCPNAGESHTVQELRSGAKHFWNTVVRILWALPRPTPAPEPGLLLIVIARNKCLFVCESIEYQQGIRRPSLRLKWR